MNTAMTREQKLERIAAGAPHPLPIGMLTAAVANGTSPTDFALAVADYSIREAEIDRVARRIAGSDAFPALTALSPTPRHLPGAEDVDAIARRIAES